MHVSFLVEQFDDHDGAAEGDGRGEEKSGERLKAEGAGNRKAAEGGETNLKTTQQEGRATEVADLIETQFEPDEEEQEDDAEFRDEFEGMVDGNQAHDGAEEEAGEKVADEGGHADTLAKDSKGCCRENDITQIQ